MKTVKVRITSDDPKQKDGASVVVEQNRGSVGWVRMDSKDMVTNGEEMTFQVKPGQRVVIEAFPQPQMVYDREQGASINPALQKNDDGRADAPKDSGKATTAQQQEAARIKAQTGVKVDQSQLKPGSTGQAGAVQGTNFKPNPQPETSPQAAVPKSGPGGTTLPQDEKK